MSQHDFVIDDQAGLSFLADLNAALGASASNSSGTTAPTTTYPNMWWADTTANRLKRRNAGNTAWIDVMSLTLATSVFGETLASASGAPAARTALAVAPRAIRIDVASVAGAVDLTANAPDTDDIQITGALAITGFTVASGRVVRVRAGGAFTLTNGASIVTPAGSNITAQAGDTFVLRATAANVVEVMFYTRDQTLQNVAASRVPGTVYTNTTGQSIKVMVALTSTAVATLQMTVGGVTLFGTFQGTTGGNTGGMMEVPAGATYSATMSAGTTSITNWLEVR